MVSLVHKFAFESSRVTAEAVSAVALPALAREWRVASTPHIILNGDLHLTGRVQEAQLRLAVQALIKRS